MKLLSAVLLIALLHACACVCDLTVWQEYPIYYECFSKNHNSTQYPYRESLYNKTKQNFINDPSKGPTPFSDWTDEEISAILNVHPNPYAQPDVPESSVYQSLKVAAASSLDWRNSGKVSEIKNQGTCGACWSFSSTALIESYFLIKSNSNKYDLSEEFLLECTENSTCAGGYVDLALDTFIAKGLPLETALPYLGTSFSGAGKPSTSASTCTSMTNTIKGSATLKTKYFANMTDQYFKIQMADSPVVTLIYADTGFMNYKSGTYSCSGTTVTGNLNHAVLAIGYDSNGNYLIKNSWGTGWGINGYGIINASSDCGMKIAVYQLNWAFRSMTSFVGAILMVILMFSF